METLAIVCAAVVLQCGAPQIEVWDYFNNSLNLEEDFTVFIQATIRCQETCPKKCLTKFIKTGKNSYWAVCGGSNATSKD